MSFLEKHVINHSSSAAEYCQSPEGVMGFTVPDWPHMGCSAPGVPFKHSL